MTQTPILLPETPERAGRARLPAGGADLLLDVLQRVRLSSAVFLRGEFSAPWAFTSTDQETLAQVVAPGAKRLVLLHLAVEGSFHITLADGESAFVQAGEAVVLPYCDVHAMAFPPGTAPVSIVELLPAAPWRELPVVCRSEGGGEATRVLCSYLHCDDLLFNPVLRALPRLVHVARGEGPAAQWREASLRYMLERPGGADALLAQLPELVLADCLRQYAESLPEDHQGWLAALADPVLARALVLLHGQPTVDWTVSELARRAAVSRSVLAERFTRKLGLSPMRYLLNWRMQIAADLLRTTRLGVAAVAARVGYDSEAAFSRAFKRSVGVSPMAWREKRS
jgi:AraC-like DNA-binding protein